MDLGKRRVRKDGRKHFCSDRVVDVWSKLYDPGNLASNEKLKSTNDRNTEGMT